MTEHTIDWSDFRLIKLCGRGGDGSGVLPPMSGINEGDDVRIMHGVVQMGIWEVTSVEHDTNKGATKIGFQDVSYSSSCSMTDETPTIEDAEGRIREVVQHGGCCRGNLIRWRDLRDRLERLWQECEKRFK